MMVSFLLFWSAVSVVGSSSVLTVAFFLALHGRSRGKTARIVGGPSVHLVRPLCGREDAADRKNLSLLRQDYSPLTVAFVAESELDLALTDARRVCATEGRGACFTAKNASAVSGKARNMIAGWHSSTSEIVGFCDSDIELSADDVGRCVAAMSECRASAAFAPCLFDAEGCWGRLAMQVATIDKFTLAEAGAVLGIVPCLEGGLMLVSRPALEAAGGIEVVSRAIADDLRIGLVLRAQGHRLGVSTAPVLHRTRSESAAVWAQRYLRWSICRRTEAPWVQVAALALHPILVPLVIAIGCSSGDALALLLIGILWRVAYAHAVSRFLLAPHGVHGGAEWCWARPIAEILDGAFMAVAFLTRSMTWRGCVYKIDFRGQITRDDEQSTGELASRRTARGRARFRLG